MLNVCSLQTSKDPNFGGSSESMSARVRFVDPAPSDLYGNITIFGMRTKTYEMPAPYTKNLNDKGVLQCFHVILGTPTVIVD